MVRRLWGVTARQRLHRNSRSFGIFFGQTMMTATITPTTSTIRRISVGVMASAGECPRDRFRATTNERLVECQHQAAVLHPADQDVLLFEPLGKPVLARGRHLQEMDVG